MCLLSKNSLENRTCSLWYFNLSFIYFWLNIFHMGESPKFTFIYSCTLKEWCCRICFIYPLIYLYRESFKYYLNKCLNHFRTMIGCILFRLNYYFHLLSKYHCNEMKRGSHLIRNSKKVFSKLWKRKFGLLTDPLHDSYLMKFFLQSPIIFIPFVE